MFYIWCSSIKFLVETFLCVRHIIIQATGPVQSEKDECQNVLQ